MNTQAAQPAPSSAILLIHCPDNKGIVATVSEFIYKNNGNITFLDQHVDSLRQVFFMRIEWELENFIIPDDKIDEIFRAGAGKQWDPEVVAAFFRIRDEIREIAKSEQDMVHVELERLV